MATAAFVALSNFSALGDAFGSASMDQFTSMAHFHDATANGMYLALSANGANLASRLSSSSLWYWTGDFGITQKVVSLKQQMLSKPLSWNALNDKIPVSTWNWIHMASVVMPPTRIWLNLLYPSQGLQPSALAGFQASGSNSYEVQNLTLDCFQYFTPEIAGKFPASILNVRSLRPS